MAYDPSTDFLALLRQVSGGVRTERMPGLDYIVAALARAGIFRLWTGQSPPVANQTTTIWLLPSSPSWVAEGAIFLWNELASAYELATPALWGSLLSGLSGGYVFQGVTAAAATIDGTTSLLAIQRPAPVNTVLTLPDVATRGGRSLQIVDWSTNVVNHVVTLSPAGGATIMRQAAWSLYSTPVQLAGVTLYPSPELNGWVIAP